MAPFDLLATPIGVGLVPRLSHLTSHLRCHALYVSVTDSGFYLTLEADSNTNCVMSGWTLGESDYEFSLLSDDCMGEENVKRDVEVTCLMNFGHSEGRL